MDNNPINRARIVRITAAALLAIALVVASGAGVYYYSQQRVSGPARSWQRYQNQQHGFTFAYPAREACHEEPVEWLGVIHIECRSFSLNVYENSSRESVETYFLSGTPCMITKSLCEYLMEGGALIPVATAGGIKTLQTERRASGAMPAIQEILVPHETHILEFSGRSRDDLETLDQIMATLKFAPA